MVDTCSRLEVLAPQALEDAPLAAVRAAVDMVEMIELSRRYEMQVKLMNTAREDDAAALALMRLG